MGIVSLITDYGYRDTYLAIVKARLLNASPSLNIVDASNDIRNRDLLSVAHNLYRVLSTFPDNSIHLLSFRYHIERNASNDRHVPDLTRFLITRYKNQYIIAPDSGIFTILDPEFNEPVYQIFYDGEEKRQFFLLDIYVPVTLHLLQEKPITEIASPINDYYKAIGYDSFLTGNVLHLKEIYVDDFGNLVTNIRKEQFYKLAGNRRFTITLPGSKITKISHSYDDEAFGQPLALFNHFGYLEIAINGASAMRFFLPSKMDKQKIQILVEFDD